ncbi:hypothetical protein [Rhodocista pekingensis]|uniref:DNA methylase N-4/N-6 domain-containing protein n=1 Tax=Rhodocista pekingensis TaxID=201185 RepID=A0ABW2KWK7_9PROT
MKPTTSSFEEWTRARTVASYGTNAGTQEIPFQGWRHFKEAFTPEIVRRAISSSPVPVSKSLDPFGGSGTTALCSQFLGVRPATIEVNPFLADLIEAKLCSYDLHSLASEFGSWINFSASDHVNPNEFFAGLPPTFVEPGKNDRWIFNYDVAARLAAYINALEQVSCPKNRRLFKVLIGGILTDVSNVVISGKGRRYRGNWQDRKITTEQIDEYICEAVEAAAADIARFRARSEMSYSIYRGSCLAHIDNVEAVDISIFSPPYPNSFDYTDVYNLELWMLGYLRNFEENQFLRRETLCSHVQVSRSFGARPTGSEILNETVLMLEAKRRELWNVRIPEMVAGYFSDLDRTVRSVASKLPRNGQIWMVVGDSRYAGVDIPVAAVMAELAYDADLDVINVEPCRSMRSSAQQGGDPSLAETLVILSRR